MNGSKKGLILIGTWSVIFGVAVMANPPNAIISTDSSNNIGIATTTPATALDVNGTTTIRKSLDIANNNILNVATPTSSADAANKAYVDNSVANISSTTAKLWSQGRVNTAVINTAGECTRVISGKTVKISRSTRPITWDKAPAACPAGWWVCSSADRGTAACGSGNRTYVECNLRSYPTPTYADDLATYAGTSGFDWAWVSDAGTTTDQPYGGFINTAGLLQENAICSGMPAWCCSY